MNKIADLLFGDDRWLLTVVFIFVLFIILSSVFSEKKSYDMYPSSDCRHYLDERVRNIPGRCLKELLK